MDYRGSLSAQGGNNGGFAEVSGKNQLTFAGAVNLSGGLGSNGTLLLDPVNVRISQNNADGVAPIIGDTPAGERPIGIGTINADALLAAWGMGNVIVHTGGVSGDPLILGDITIESDVQMVADTVNSLTFFAHNNITVAPNENVALGADSGPVHILNKGTGNINLVSGWDGFGENSFSSSLSTIGGNQQAINHPANIGIAELLDPAQPYGDYGGQGTIALNPNASFQVIIGSAKGQTNLLGNHITMTPGDQAGEFVQIGWYHDGTDTGGVVGATPLDRLNGITGDINIHAKGNLVATNSVLPGVDWRYLQIGHGGRMNSSTAGVQDRVLRGDITVDVAGSLSAASGGTSNGWFKIGHGGKSDPGSAPNLLADVRVNSYGNIDVAAGGMTFQEITLPRS